MWLRGWDSNPRPSGYEPEADSGGRLAPSLWSSAITPLRHWCAARSQTVTLPRQPPPRYTPWPPSTRRYKSGCEPLCCDIATTRPDMAILIERILERKPHPEHGFRSCVGILRLLKALRRGMSSKPPVPAPWRSARRPTPQSPPTFGNNLDPAGPPINPAGPQTGRSTPAPTSAVQPLLLRSAEVGATPFAELGFDLQEPRRKASGRQIDHELEHFHQRVT